MSHRMCHKLLNFVKCMDFRCALAIEKCGICLLKLLKIKEFKSTHNLLALPVRIRIVVVPCAINFLFPSNEIAEDRLITTIKRCILCIQEGDYEKAEKMLHLALRMAQDIQSKDGITYVFDIMANLAVERQQFDKAEILFAEIMKILFANKDANIAKILHISSKMAHIAALKGELGKAVQGFTWTLGEIENNLKNSPDDKNMQELLGLTKNWFGQLQMKRENYDEAKKLFIEAYECLTLFYGTINEEALIILNNLSVVCVYLDDFNEAKRYSFKAMDVAKDLKDITQEGILQANLGLIYLKEGLITEAKKMCSKAWKIANKTNNAVAVEQAEYCLNEIDYYNKLIVSKN